MKRFQRRSRKYCPEVRGSFGHQLQIFIWKWLKENKAIFVIEYPSEEGLKFRLAPPPPWPPACPAAAQCHISPMTHYSISKHARSVPTKCYYLDIYSSLNFLLRTFSVNNLYQVRAISAWTDIFYVPV